MRIIFFSLLSCFIFFLQCSNVEREQKSDSINKNFIVSHGAIIRGDTTQQKIALVFTGDEFADGGNHIKSVLKRQRIKASFFFTGNFYRNSELEELIIGLKSDGHYLGAHSDKHLLYCSWENRDSLLVDKVTFLTDLKNSYLEMARFGIKKNDALYFMPPYEWYNQTIADWTNEFGLQLINFTPGTRSNADYTIPSMGKKYISSSEIYSSILNYEKQNKTGLNGFILLIHIGTHPERKDKFYLLLDKLISELKSLKYQFVTIDNLLD